MKQFFQVTTEAASEFFEDDAMSLAAALALYTVIALAPLVTVMLTIAGMIFGEQASIGFVQQAEGLIGKSGAEAIRGIVEKTRANRAPAYRKRSSASSSCFRARRLSSRSCRLR